MPRSKSSPVHVPATTGSSPSFIVRVQHSAGCTRVGVTRDWKLVDLLTKVVADALPSGTSASTVALAFPSRANVLDADGLDTLADIGATSHGDMLYLVKRAGSGGGGGGGGGSQGVSSGSSGSSSGSSKASSSSASEPAEPAAASSAKKRKCAVPAAHSARAGIAPSELAVRYRAETGSMGAKAFCQFTGAAMVDSCETGRFTVTPSGGGKAKKAKKAKKGKGKEALGDDDDDDDDEEVLPPTHISAWFRGNSGKEYDQRHTLLGLPYICEVVEQIREKSSSKRRRATCVGLKSLDPMAMAMRCPPMFWSIVYVCCGVGGGGER